MNQQIQWHYTDGVLPRGVFAGVQFGVHETTDTAIVLGISDIAIIEGPVDQLRRIFTNALAEVEQLARTLNALEEPAPTTSSPTPTVRSLR